MKKLNIPYWAFFAIAVVEIVIITAAILLIAGRTDYWQGWVFGAVTLILIIITLLIFRDKMDLARERISPGPGMKWWDKIFWAFYLPAFLLVPIIAPLDAGRFFWSPDLPLIIYIISYIIYISSIAIYTWGMYINKWFSSVVRIQKDRAQKVVQEGPYKYMRHPGYLGGILMALSMALILGSLWALIPAGVVVIALLIRTFHEDRTLKNELEGYKEYAKKVPYRIIPGIW